MWFSVVLNQIIHNTQNQGISAREYDPTKEISMTYDQIVLADGMNHYDITPNPYGCNPFEDGKLECDFLENRFEYSSFNKFLKVNALSSETENSNVTINCIVENPILGGKLELNGKPDEHNIIRLIPLCKYLVCTNIGFYGLQIKYEDGKFSGFTMYDLGRSIPTIENSTQYEFQFCCFNAVNDQTTLFVAFKDKNDKKQYITYFNEETYDEVYGLSRIKTLTMDGIVVEPYDLFNKVESIRELDIINIAMTDSGFWDIEPNMTNDVVVSYRGNKNYSSGINYQDNATKLVLPTTSVSSTDKVVQYDTIWKLSGEYMVHDAVRYPKYILDSANGFLGAVDGEFAVYDGTDMIPAHILVNIQYDMFSKMLISNAYLFNSFMKWFYGQVSVEKPGEKYLQDNYTRFAESINAKLSNWSFLDQQYDLKNKSYLKIGNTISSLVAPSSITDYNRISKYCTALSGLVSTDASDYSGLYNRWFDSPSIDGNIKSDFIGKFNKVYLDKGV